VSTWGEEQMLSMVGGKGTGEERDGPYESLHIWMRGWGGQRRKQPQQRSGFYSIVAGDGHDLSIHQQSALKVSQLMKLFRSSFDFRPHGDAQVKVQRTQN